jgi:hypothetical protein
MHIDYTALIALISCVQIKKNLFIAYILDLVDLAWAKSIQLFGYGI